jgi:hypothetical protein
VRGIIDKIIESSKSNYSFKAKANLVLVIVGVILIANPIAFTWLKSTGMVASTTNDMDLTNLNYFLGGIGIVAFVTTFFNRPQKQMTVAIGDLARMLFICMMYKVQFHTLLGRIQEEITNKYNAADTSAERHDCVKDTNAELYDITSKTVRLIEDCLERYAKDESKKKYGLSKSSIMEKISKLTDDKKLHSGTNEKKLETQ